VPGNLNATVFISATTFYFSGHDVLLLEDNGVLLNIKIVPMHCPPPPELSQINKK
jgi:hypothetical protein